jgi:hypothetical protein
MENVQGGEKHHKSGADLKWLSSEQILNDIVQKKQDCINK